MKINSSSFSAKFLITTFALAMLLLVASPHSAVAQTNTFPASGNVGIGTTNPQYGNLQVNKIIRIDDDSGSPNGSDTLGISPGLYLGTSTGGSMFQFNGSGGIDLWAYNSGWSRQFTFAKTGLLGIKNMNPLVPLDIVNNNVGWGGQIRLAASDYSQITFYNSGNLVLGEAGRRGDIHYDFANSRLVVENTNGGAYNGILSLNPGGGNVGIGTTSPATKLYVAGDATVTGNLTVSGNINAKYQDVAEWVESSQSLPAGTVVVLDGTKSNQVIASSYAYDTRVAEVVSEQPGIALGESGENKVLVATTGRVKVAVDATRVPIRIGDLLVTSDMPGVAMKSEPIMIGGRQIHSPGTLIGKALEPLEKSSGKILV